MAEGQEPGDTVWRSAIKKEAAVGNGKEAVTLQWDMKKAYEVIEYNHLIKEAEALRYPMKLLRVHIAMYSSDRYVRMNGMVKNAGAAGRGICAGCGAATTHSKVHHLRPMEKVALTIPRVRLKVFVDDLQLDQEDSETDLMRYFPKAAAAVLKMLKEDLKADVAEDKAALVAGNQKLAAKREQP